MYTHNIITLVTDSLPPPPPAAATFTVNSCATNCIQDFCVYFTFASPLYAPSCALCLVSMAPENFGLSAQSNALWGGQCTKVYVGFGTAQSVDVLVKPSVSGTGSFATGSGQVVLLSLDVANLGFVT